MTLSISAFTEGDEMGSRAVPCQGWQPIETAPKQPRAAGWSRGPLVWLLIPYSPNPEPDVGWWSEGYDCFRFTGEDGPNDIQPIAWAPLAKPPAEPCDAGPTLAKAEGNEGSSVDA
jgi:hypothetical protein